MADPAPAVTDDHPKVVFHDDADDIFGLEKPWNDLLVSKDEPLFFQSPAWLRHVAATKAAGADGSWRMCIASTWRGDRLTAIWPLSLQREGLCWIARSLDDPFGQFAGCVAADDEDPDHVIGAIARAIKAEGRAAGLMIERVMEGTVLHQGLLSRGARATYSDRAAVLDLRPFDTYQDYLKTRKAKTRKNLRNALNRLQRDHDVEHEIVTDAEAVQAIMDQAFEARLDWMQEQAKTSPAFRDPLFRRLIDGLTASGLKGELIAFQLKAKDVPISVQWGFVHGGRYYAFISARNQDFDAYSPGRLHLGMVLEACFERGIDVVELMAPASDYKMNWTDETRRIDDLGLPLTAAGYLYLELWRRHGRTMVRRLYHGLPDGLRRHVADMTNRNRAS